MQSLPLGCVHAWHKICHSHLMMDCYWSNLDLFDMTGPSSQRVVLTMSSLDISGLSNRTGSVLQKFYRCLLQLAWPWPITLEVYLWFYWLILLGLAVSSTWHPSPLQICIIPFIQLGHVVHVVEPLQCQPRPNWLLMGNTSGFNAVFYVFKVGTNLCYCLRMWHSFDIFSLWMRGRWCQRLLTDLRLW